MSRWMPAQTDTSTSKTKCKPWRHMADTFTWVDEQQRLQKSGWHTAQWVFEQQMRAIYGSETDDDYRSHEARRAETPLQPHNVNKWHAHKDPQLERGRKKKHARDKITWEDYQLRWDVLYGSTQPLSFADIPWPQCRQPLKAQHVTAKEVVAFLALDPDDVHRRKRALLVWHPDRFRRLMCRVIEADKGKVEEAVGIVARVLTAKDTRI